jgi:hypothetical protein
VALLCASQLPAADLKPKEFKDGIKAQDDEKWPESAKLMSEALAKQPEDGEGTRIYGTKFVPYLPQFFLGLALYKQGDCRGALREWEQCLSSGAIVKTNRFAELQQYMAECKKR